MHHTPLPDDEISPQKEKNGVDIELLLRPPQGLQFWLKHHKYLLTAYNSHGQMARQKFQDNASKQNEIQKCG